MGRLANSDRGSILITGAAGFMGSHLVPRLLSDGYDVTAVDLKGSFERGGLQAVRNKIRIIETDVTNYEELNRIDVNPDYIHHLAAIAAPGLCKAQPKLAYDVNVTREICLDAAAIKFMKRKKSRSSFGIIDGIVLATARSLGQNLLTFDADFAGERDCVVLR